MHHLMAVMSARRAIFRNELLLPALQTSKEQGVIFPNAQKDFKVALGLMQRCHPPDITSPKLSGQA